MRSRGTWALWASLLCAGCPADPAIAADADASDGAPDSTAPDSDGGGEDAAVQDSVSPKDTWPTFPDTREAPDTTRIHDVRFDTTVAPACARDEDCGYCATPKPPSAGATCYCPECNVAVMAVSECQDNAAAWQQLCGGRDADGALCPLLECRDPGPVACDRGSCVALER